MVSRRPSRTHQGSGRMDMEGSQVDRRERLNDQEVNQGEDGGENIVLPPPPPPVELAQVLANQTPDGSHIQCRQPSKAPSFGHE
jgi:hypothetical protein